MSKLLAALVLLLLALGLHAQTDTDYDVIHLKDGSFYRGRITEYVVDDHATIKLLDDRIVVVKTEDIQRMTVSKDMIIQKKFNIKDKGYFHNSLIGAQFGSARLGSVQATFAYNMVNGYRIKKHHMGLGVGIENHLSNWYAPIYADYSYHIVKGHLSPVVGINGGFMAPLNNEFISQYDFRRGSFIGGRIGFVAYSNPRFAFLLNITYRYIHFSGAEYTWNPWWGEGHNINGSAQIHRLGVMLGFVFN